MQDILNDMPTWMGFSFLGLSLLQWLGLFLIVVLSCLTHILIRLITGKIAVHKLLERKIKLDEKRKQSFTLPFGILACSATWLLGVQALELPPVLLSILLRIGYIILTIGAVWASHHLVDLISFYFEKLAKKTDSKFDDILVPLLRKIAKIFVVCIGIIFIGKSFTLNITNLVAGMGIGGLAIALAAKDTIANFFGSITVILDRPFQLGDYISIDGKIEGEVEHVGFRSTRIRTFYNSLISVPNSQLTNLNIDNYGKRKYRRCNINLGIQYDTPPEKIEAFCEGIRQLILTHKWTRKDLFHVYFNNYADFSLNILVYLFWEVPDWGQELQERHRLFLDILRLSQKMKIDFAFPTQTLHMFKEDIPDPHTIDFEKTESHNYAKNLAKEIASDTLTTSKPRSGIKNGNDFPGDKFSL